MAPIDKKFTLNWVQTQVQKLGSNPLTVRVHPACYPCRQSRQREHAPYTRHTLLQLTYTRRAPTDTRRVYKRAIHYTNAHSATRAGTQSARKTQKEAGACARRVPTLGFEPRHKNMRPTLSPLDHCRSEPMGGNRRTNNARDTPYTHCFN